MEEKIKTARKSFGNPYKCKCNWNDETFVQCGDTGIVFSKDGNYTTAFFEAFPENPKTFIRGEGKSIEEAELSAFNQLELFKKCKKHKFERKGYDNGAGFCKYCGLFKSNAFEPLTKCIICGKSTYYSFDKENNPYCKKCYNKMPKEMYPNWKKYLLNKKNGKSINTM